MVCNQRPGWFILFILIVAVAATAAVVAIVTHIKHYIRSKCVGGVCVCVCARAYLTIVKSEMVSEQIKLLRRNFPWNMFNSDCKHWFRRMNARQFVDCSFPMKKKEENNLDCIVFSPLFLLYTFAYLFIVVH